MLLDEYSRQRGQITAGGQLLAYSVATDSRFRFLRVYPNAAVYAPVTGFYSLRYSSTGLERAEDPLLNGSDERLFGRRLADFFTGRDPRGGNVDTTINPRIQQAAWDAMQQGCGGACKRRGGGPGAVAPARSWRWCPRRRYDANLLASHDPDAAGARRGSSCATTPTTPLINRAISRDLPARVDVQGDHHRGRAAERHAPKTTQLTAAASIPLPDSTATLENYGGTPCGNGANRIAPRGIRPVLQHRVRPARPAHRRRRTARHGPSRSAWTPRRRRSRCRSPSPPSARSRTPRRWA